MLKILFIFGLWLCGTNVLVGQDTLTSTYQEKIYGRKDGMALTMLVYKPNVKSNGKGIILVVSGGWGSGHEMALRFFNSLKVYRERGYTMFSVMHGSQPKYTVPEVISDIHRAVRFIRYRARDFGIDPDNLGIIGNSAGGHLALMIATAKDSINLQAKDPIDRASSRVQAAACFFPATDFLNWGKLGENKAIDKPFLSNIGAAASFDFKEWNSTTKTFQSISDPNHLTKIARMISPIYHVTPDDPPIIIAHGDEDNLSPLQQSEIFVAKLKEKKIPHKLLIKKGGGHGWQGMDKEAQEFTDWFDKYLKIK